MKNAMSQDIAKLILRLTVGGLMVFHGVAKLFGGIDGIKQALAAHKLPGVLAYGVYVGEVIAPILLIAGLWTRAAALVIAINMVVAETLALALALAAILLTPLRDMDVIWQVAVAIALAALLPILFFPYSRGLWMALDLTLHPPGPEIERQLRGAIDRGNG